MIQKVMTMTSNFQILLLYKLFLLLLVAILMLLNIGSTIAFIPHRQQQQQSIQVSFHNHQHQLHNLQYNTIVQQIGLTQQNQNQKQLITNPIINSRRTIAKSSSSSKLYGLFGLGFLEIGIILVGVGVVIGPAGIASVAKSAASRTSELANEMKTIPKEFQDGLEIGETEARSRKAKRIIINKNTKSSTDNNSSNEDN